MDLRRENITCYPPIYSQLVEKYNIIDYIPGHVKTIGQHAYKMKNPIWKIKENEKEYFLMYCEKDTLCKLCPVSYQKILDFEIENNNGEKMTFLKMELIIFYLILEPVVFISIKLLLVVMVMVKEPKI